MRLSAPLQSKTPCVVGSTVPHFISLPGVTTENWLAATAAHAGVLMSWGIIALPTRRPIAAARSRSESLAGFGKGGTAVGVVAALARVAPPRTPAMPAA